MQQETNLTQLTTENSEELRKNIELFRQIFNLIISDPQFSSGYHYTKVVNLIETYGPQPWSQIEEMITSNSANTRKELIEFISGIRQGYFEILYRMESKLNIQSRMEKVSDAFNVKRSNGIILSFSPKIE